jgi:hypothetical protein
VETYGTENIENKLGHLSQSSNDAIDGGILLAVLVVGGNGSVLEDSDGGEKVHCGE